MTKDKQLMTWISPEVSAILTPALVTVGLAFSAFVGAWLKMKTVKWERMTQEAVSRATQAVANTEVTQGLVRENTRITKEVAENTNGALLRLDQSRQRAQDLRAQMESRIAEEPSSQLKDDLDEMSESFQRKENIVREQDHKNEMKKP